MRSSDSATTVAMIFARQKPLRKIIVFLVSLVVLAIAGLALLHCCVGLEKDSFAREVGIVLLQIIAVGVLGSVFSVLLAQYTAGQERLLADQQRNEEQEQLAADRARAAEQSREQEERLRTERVRDAERIVLRNRNELKKDVIRRISHIYNETKGARRMLRAKALSTAYNDKNVVNANLYIKPYAQYMEVINDLQLELEAIREEIKSDKAHVSYYAKDKTIQDGMREMEHYLGDLISEYETSRTKFNDKAYAPYMEFDKLKDLLSSARQGSATAFRKQYIENYKKVISYMLDDLVSPEENGAKG